MGGRSTGMNLTPQQSVKVYELFVKSLVKIFNEFNADYIDIKGDGAFALFSGRILVSQRYVQQ